MAVWLRNRFGWWKLPAGSLVLGRHHECDLHLDDPRLSRRHCRLTADQDRLTVVDLGSSNGVLINGDRVESVAECRHGDLLIAGPFTFEVDIQVEEPCPERLEGSLLQSGRNTDPGRDPEFMPSTDRLLRTTAEMEWASDPKTGEPLTPNPESPGDAGGRVTDDDALDPRDADEPRHPFADSDADDARGDDDEKPVQTTGSNLRPQSRRSSTQALTPNDPDSRLRLELRSAIGRRFLAAALDLGTCLLLALALALPGVVGGYAGALRQAGASLDHGVPVLVAEAEPAGLLDLAGSLITASGRSAAPLLLDTMRAEHRSAFLIFFVGTTATVLAWVLIGIVFLVAATMVKGAPYWHRKLDLVIRETESGYYPSAPRCLARWGLLLLLAWAAPICIALARRSPHDLLSGCTLRRRDVETDSRAV